MLLLAWAPAGHAQGGPLAPPANGGIARLDWLLQRLAEPRRVLVIAAHPDDEDTSLLTLAARGWGADAAYLSLSRGEGGQNLIGAELGVALGLLRGRELEAARAIDGAQQYFTRAYDFGYTRSLAETEDRWLVDSVFKDVVRIVRRFRPHVIVATFRGTSRDGHGQHQFAGVMARRAFAESGDGAVFSELGAEEGLAPWTPLKLYRSTRFEPEATTLTLPAAGLDPRGGRTVHQIAMDSRSRHRSQDFGVLQDIGGATVTLALEASRTSRPADTALFDGIPRPVSWLGTFADSLRGVLTPVGMHATAPALAAALRRVRTAGADRGDAEELLTEALAIAAGILVDARTSEASLVPGESTGVTVALRNAGPLPVSWEGTTLLAGADGWRDTIVIGGGDVVPAGGDTLVAAPVVVPLRARPTRPYFGSRPLQGALYDWSTVEPPLRGRPHQPAPLTARFHLRVADVAVVLEREVTVRIQDQALGEVRRPFVIVPAVDVTLTPDTAFWPLRGPAPPALTAELWQHAGGVLTGALRIVVDGEIVGEQAVALTHRGTRVALPVALPAPLDAGDLDVRAAFVADGGAVFAEGSATVTYPHIRPVTWVRPAVSRVRVADITLPTGRRIGYVRGASDRVPEALARAGIAVTLLDSAALAAGALDGYDVIVIGSRAYETEPALAAANDRLLAWVRAGGHLVVQYQQYQYVRGGFAPYPFRIGNPHDRVTDETSPVTMLEPGHAVFMGPNRIGERDWDGWPQERGLYFANTWDDAYTALLEMPDPEGRPVRGGLLMATVGRGTYVYTGLSFFRALPAGVPGAFRLFVNLLDMRDRG